MGANFSSSQNTNSDASVYIFGGTGIGYTTGGASVWRTDGSSWSKDNPAIITPTGASGYTGTSQFIGALTSDVNEDGDKFVISNFADEGLTGTAGAIWIYNYNSGTTTWDTFTKFLPQATSQYFFGWQVACGPSISGGNYTQSVFTVADNQNSGAVGTGLLIPQGEFLEFNSVTTLWDRGTLFDLMPSTTPPTDYYSYAYLVKSTGDIFLSITKHDNTRSGLLFMQKNFYSVNASSTRTIINPVSNTDYVETFTVSADGQRLIVVQNSAGNYSVHLYDRIPSSPTDTFVDPLSYVFNLGTPSGSGYNISTNQNGTKLYVYVIPSSLNPVPPTIIKYYDLPTPGIGGISQNANISNGQDGSAFTGGKGTFNPGLNTGTSATGGGQGGASDTSTALPSYGGGGLGKTNASGTAGGSGYAIVRNWNSGI